MLLKIKNLFINRPEEDNVAFIKTAYVTIQNLGFENLKVVGDKDKLIERVALVNGAGGRSESLFINAVEKADLLISSEFKYSLVRQAHDINFNIVETGHYNSENPFVDWATLILNKLKDINVVKFNSTDPYKE